MKADDFAGAVRKCTGTFAVNKLALRTPSGVVRGKGHLSICDNGFEIEFDVEPGSVPHEDKVFWHEADFWSVEGLIERDLRFRCVTATPSGHLESWHIGRKPRLIQKLSLGPINLLPTRGESRGRAQIRRLAGRSTKPKAKYPSVRFEAALMGCSSLFRNAGTKTETRNDFTGKTTKWTGDTFIDRAPDYDLALIQDGDDLSVHFRSKSRFRSENEESDWLHFQALLSAIGFVHGFHPWPYRIQYWRDGREPVDRLAVNGVLPKTIHTPFRERIGLSSPVARRGAVNSPIRIAARFFARNSEMRKNIAELLFLFREAGGRSAHHKLQTLALCALLEGLIRMLFNNLELEAKLRRADSHFDSFAVLRDEFRQFVANRKFADEKSVARMLGSLTAAEALGVRDKFRALCDHFGLSDADMKPHLTAWDSERNPLMHGRFESRDTDFRRQGLIAGAINIFILKVMGFSGSFQVDIFGDPPTRMM